MNVEEQLGAGALFFRAGAKGSAMHTTVASTPNPLQSLLERRVNEILSNSRPVLENPRLEKD